MLVVALDDTVAVGVADRHLHPHARGGVVQRACPAGAEESTEAVLAALNDVLHVWFAGRRSFVTATYATLTAADEGLNTHVCNGGHPPAFLLRADGEVRQFSDGGRALGLAAESRVACEQECLRPGDSLVFYTDGVTESRPPGRPGDQFGEDGIAQTLADLPAGVNAETIADALSTAALDHAGGTVPDDTAIVVVRSPHISPVRRAGVANA